MNFRNALIVASALVFAVGCSQSSEETTFPESQEEVKAPDSIQSSFRGVRKAPKKQKNFTNSKSAKKDLKTLPDSMNIAVHKDSLEKEFLFRGQMIMQQPIPNFNGLKSRVVAFKKVADNKLLMLEATKGHNVSKDLKSSIILAEFKIISEADGWIEFDFNHGMKQLFLASDWYAQDYSGPGYQDTFSSVDSKISYLEDVTYASNRISITQISQFATLFGWSPTIEAKYYLSPYRPSADFVPTLSKRKNYKHFAFFETAPFLTNDGVTEIYATKFNINKPIVFAVSENTPAEYKDAVKEGVLYFNKIFKKEVVQVVDAPKGVNAPNLDYNIIQWADWDTAGFAYADAQSDPRTGEIQNAQVFFTSVFAIGSKVRARRILQRIASDEANPEAPKNILFGLQGFLKDHNCMRSAYDRKMKESLTALVNSEATDEQILAVSQDYVREVVAHEVGHTLGLRHNFAASLAMDYSLEKRREIHNDYVINKKAKEDVVPATSVMEYNRFEEATLLGDLIEQGKTFAYDDKAINILYNDTNPDPDNNVLFCTDSHAGVFADCIRFDIGRTITEATKWEETLSLESLPSMIAEAYISAVDPTPGRDKVDVKNVMLSPSRYSQMILGSRSAMVAALNETKPLLRIHRMFDVIGELNADDVKAAKRTHIDSEIKSAGGLEALFDRIPADWAATNLERLEKLLDSPAYTKGLGPGGNGFEFTADDKKVILKNSKRLLEAMEKNLHQMHLKNLGTVTMAIIDKLNEPLAMEFAKLLADNVEHYVFEVKDTLVGTIRAPKDDKGNQKEILANLPVFHYDLETRQLAAGLLNKSSALSERFFWGKDEKKALKETMTELLKEAFGKDEKSTGYKMDDQSREIAIWLGEFNKLRGAGGYMF